MIDSRFEHELSKSVLYGRFAFILRIRLLANAVQL
jgi:hypothetical protein